MARDAATCTSRGAPVTGCPTSKWKTFRPAASSPAAAATTSITLNDRTPWLRLLGWAAATEVEVLPRAPATRATITTAFTIAKGLFIKPA